LACGDFRPQESPERLKTTIAFLAGAFAGNPTVELVSRSPTRRPPRPRARWALLKSW
jgi:hypothetical protein